MSQLKFWTWLSALDSVSARKRAHLLSHFGTVEDIYYATEADYKAVPGIDGRDRRELLEKSFVRAETVLEICEKKQIRVITIQDAEYPDRLKNIDAPPLVLYTKGRFPLFDEEVAVAVVGSRKHTAYGRLVAERISYELAVGGALVVSGMARGIDSCANRGALNAGKPTVAVLGCGADVVYPAENRELYEEISVRGCIVTEYTPGTRPFGGNFPVRNRIISGLSLGTLIVEAPRMSGALITANCALEQGRDVFAVPGNIDIAVNEGGNELIKEGAKLVTSASDILVEYVHLFPHKLTLPPEKSRYERASEDRPPDLMKVAQSPSGYARKSAKPAPPPEEAPKEKITEEMIKGFTEPERKIIVSIIQEPRHIDEITELCGISPADCLSALTMLEIEGAVRQTGAKYFAIDEAYFTSTP
ncbi:DNA-processing protein DprA [Oscillospiraceae bacterium OttesenSCG-928-G22]|nr:DNA-processing protein DprA [Oscillospiraceae bacterium OttesenSCG-928-G22]